jgi:hypothetical protein
MWLESVYFMVVLTKIPLLTLSLYVYIYMYMMVIITKLKDNISQIEAHA